MHDPRVDQLARQLVRYSTRVKRGEKVLLDLCDVPEEVGIALIRQVRMRGGMPFLQLQANRLVREMWRGATDEQFRLVAKHRLAEMRDMDAYIAVRGSGNIAELGDVPAARMDLVTGHFRKVLRRRIDRTKWCVLRWPHSAMAQQAGMSTEAFEDFFFRVCLLDYGGLLPAMRALKRLMERTREVHIKGPGTDLRFSIEGMPAVVCGGTHNIPDGEVFTAPVRNSVEGRVSFNAPTIYHGAAFDGIGLEFAEGRVVKAAAGGGRTRAVNRILDADAGARFIGEFALGLNPEIREPMRDILFDEKIAGSFHFTPGQAYEEADNGNRSKVHWDMVSIQRPDHGGGEIWFDGRLGRRDGRFLSKALARLNP